MTELQKRCQELLPVIQAGAEGKALECFPKDSSRGWIGVDGPYPSFFFDLRYRIKPEPQYRPFTPEEAVRLCGRKFKSSGAMDPTADYVIRSATDKAVRVLKCGASMDGEYALPFDCLLAIGTWSEDGARCGVKVSD